MDMYNSSGNMYGQPVSGNHSDRMEIAAMTLGIISIVSCTCLYLAIPCGALAIILASLSRGGQMRYGAKAQVGLILGIIGIVLKGCHLYFGVCIYTARVRKYRRYSQSLLRHDRYRLQPAAATIKDDMSHHGISGHCKHQIFDEAVGKYEPKCDPQIDIPVAHTDCDFSFGQPLYRLGNHKPAAKNGRIYNDRMVIKGF